MRNAFAAHLLNLARKDQSILLITGDLGFGVFDDFQKELPKQFINAGVAEQTMMSMAGGLAASGFRPFVYSIANFPTFRCLEQIRNDVSYMDNPVTIVAVGAGLVYGVHGYSHHAVEDITIMRSLSNLTIYSPCDSVETIFSIDRILESNHPAYLRLGKGGEPVIHKKSHLEIQDVNIVDSGEEDGLICWTGGVGFKVLQAAELLKQRGLRPKLVSIPVLNSQAIEKLLVLNQNQLILTVEEHSLSGGFGSLILEVAADSIFSGRIVRLGIPQHINKEIGSHEYLLEKSGLSPDAISQRFESEMTQFRKK
jgi:transketolase